MYVARVVAISTSCQISCPLELLPKLSRWRGVDVALLWPLEYPVPVLVPPAPPPPGWLLLLLRRLMLPSSMLRLLPRPSTRPRFRAPAATAGFSSSAVSAASIEEAEGFRHTASHSCKRWVVVAVVIGGGGGGCGGGGGGGGSRE